MSDAWPPVSIQKRRWHTNPQQVGPSGNRPNRADRSLAEITVEIPQPISDQPVRLAGVTQAACEEASADLSSLESRARHLSGLGELLVRTEAVASSKIEHIYADLDDIARATIGEQAGTKARQTMAAAQALSRLTASCNDGRPLTERSILAAHGELLGDDLLEKNWAARYRQQQNWIGGSDFSPRNAVHIPPPPDDVEPLMQDLVKFANRDDMSAIAQSAIVHGQFEAIHPFTDGNGRIGRALIGATLRRRRVTGSVTVPVAAAMLAAVDEYFDRLHAYRTGDADALVSYVAQSASAAAAASLVSADRLARLPEQWHEFVGARRGSSAHKLVGGLLYAPILDIDRATEVTGSTRIRTYEALDRLVDAGVLDEITGAGRNRIWVASDVMTELADLEERIGLRSKPSQRWREAP